LSSSPPLLKLNRSEGNILLTYDNKLLINISLAKVKESVFKGNYA
jgi:hypothetical protein